MAVAGFKIAVNYCIRPFKGVPIALYTDIPSAYIKCIPEDTGNNSISRDRHDSEELLPGVSLWVQEFLERTGLSNKAFRFEIKLLPQTQITLSFQKISIQSSICSMLNEWLHHPMKKNELLAWLIEKNQFKDADIISASIYGGIMSHVGVRPFRIYQPKGLYFRPETISESDAKFMSDAIIPIFIIALERSDFGTLHELLYQINPVGNMQESYLGVLDIPGSSLRLHIYNVSIPEYSSPDSDNTYGKMFKIDSNGSSVV